MNIFSINIETLSHIAGIVGLGMTIFSGVLIWRKGLLKAGFLQFRDLYMTEMLDFKTEIRNYINKSDAQHSRTLERIAELYEKTHQEISKQTESYNLIQMQRSERHKINEAWRKKLEVKFNELEKKIDEDYSYIKDEVDYIRECVNNKENASSFNELEKKIDEDYSYIKDEVDYIRKCVNNKENASSKTRRRRKSPGT